MNLANFVIISSSIILGVSGSNLSTIQDLTQQCRISSSGICLPMSYDKHKIPSKPIKIDVKIAVAHISEVDDELSTIDVLASLAFLWEDKRLLQLNATETPDDDDVVWHELNLDWEPLLWLPDIHVMGMKQMKISSFLKPFKCNSNIFSLKSPKR